MSVLIEDMTLPRTCWDCPLCDYGSLENCTLLDSSVSEDDRRMECPLKESSNISAHWEWDSESNTHKCSNCGTEAPFSVCKNYEPRNYCPKCGAKMDLEI